MKQAGCETITGTVAIALHFWNSNDATVHLSNMQYHSTKSITIHSHKVTRFTHSLQFYCLGGGWADAMDTEVPLLKSTAHRKGTDNVATE